MKITDAAAACLVQRPWFGSGYDTSNSLSLFAHVPVQRLMKNHEPILTYFADSESLTIDLLLCRGGEREVVFGVMFDTEERLAELTEVFEQDLCDLPYLFLCVGPYLSPEEETRICAQVCAYADDKLLHPGTGARFTLPALSLARAEGGLRPELKRYGEEELRQLLTRRRLLSGDGASTLYGRDHGVFFQWFADAFGRPTRTLMVAEGMADAVNDALFGHKKRHSDRAPLEERLNRLNRGLPASDVYGEQTAASLRQLLDTPLEYFCGQDSALWHGLSIGAYRLGHVAEPDLCSISGFTYRDALAIIHDLTKRCLATPLEGRDPNDSANAYISASYDCITLLRELADRLFASQKSHRQKGEPTGGVQSLETRLSALDKERSGGLPILRAQLSYYYHAAAVLDESDYPNWFYSLFFHALRSGMHLEEYHLEHVKEEELTLSFCVDVLLCREEFNTNLWGFELDSFEAFWLLYSLLVEPVFPDADVNAIGDSNMKRQQEMERSYDRP